MRLIGRNRYTSAYRDEGLLKFGKIACGVSLLTGARDVDRLEANKMRVRAKKERLLCHPFSDRLERRLKRWRRVREVRFKIGAI